MNKSSLITFDAHIDLPWKAWKCHKRDESMPRNYYKEFMSGGLNAAVFALYMPDTQSPEDMFRGLTWQRSYLTARPLQYIKRNNLDKLVNHILFHNGLELGDPFSFYLSLEGTKALSHPSRFTFLKDSEVKIVGMTHNHNTDWADSSTDVPQTKGLKRHGLRIVNYCNKNNITLDISHASDDTAKAILDYASKPVIASHSACRSLVDHPRNVSDELIKLVAKTGGVIGIPFAAKFVGENRSCLIDHIDHVCQVTGSVKHVGIGSDLEGAAMFEGVTSSQWSQIVLEQLQARKNYSNTDIECIAGWNFLRAIG